MVPANLYLFPLTLWLSVFDLDLANSRELPRQKYEDLPSPTGCINCTICPYPCHTLSPPPPGSGYPLYGSPPPPPGSGYPLYGNPPPPPDSGYPLYGAPPTPAQGNCTTVPIQCCHFPPPTNPYTYIPDKNFSPCPYLALSFFSFVTLVTSFAALF